MALRKGLLNSGRFLGRFASLSFLSIREMRPGTLLLCAYEDPGCLYVLLRFFYQNNRVEKLRGDIAPSKIYTETEKKARSEILRVKE